MSTQLLACPDAIGIGFRRCASSWLHSVLNEHPSIGKPTDGLHFFSDEYDRGIDFYRESLSSFADQDKLIEYSVSYTYPECCDLVARRIFEFSPDVKLFATVRNPIDRAFSDYLRSKRLLEIPASVSFEEAIESGSIFLDRSMYGRIFAPYFELFPADQIRILFYEDLKDDPATFLSDLFEFLDVEPVMRNCEQDRKGKSGGEVSSATLNRVIFSAKSKVDHLMNRVAPNSWQAFKSRYVGLYSGIIAANTKPADMQPETRDYLREYFESDLEAFASLTNCDVSRWI